MLNVGREVSGGGALERNHVTAGGLAVCFQRSCHSQITLVLKVKCITIDFKSVQSRKSIDEVYRRKLLST